MRKYHSNGINKYSVLICQKKEITENYSFIKCHIQGQYFLFCEGEIQNLHSNYTYRFTIKYFAGREPLVKILNDDIKPNRNIHMYADRHLCLAMPSDVNWASYPSLTKYTIPWLIEWTYYYEIYKRNNSIWEGREAPKHFIYELDNQSLFKSYSKEN